jgi:Tfp pilus assembly protein PilN
MKISLDLLPQNKKAEIRRDKLFREILKEELMFVFPLLVLIAILGNIYYLLTIQKSINNNAYEFQQGQGQYKELNKYDKEFKKINETDNFLIRIQSGHLRWANILNRLGQAIPGEVMIDSLANKNFNVYLVGNAKTRDDLLEFKSNLEKDSCFQNVNVPLSNLVVKDNVDFQMDFSVTQACLKGQ